MPKEMLIEKEIIINKDLQDVFNFLKYTKNQDQFSVWNMKDPNAVKNYTGTDGTKGFIYTWNSKDKSVGAGAQEITNIVSNSRIDYELRFTKPMKNTATSAFILEPAENSTSVTWIFKGVTKFPMSLFASMFKKMLGKQLEQSLQNLKTLLEKQ